MAATACKEMKDRRGKCRRKRKGMLRTGLFLWILQSSSCPSWKLPWWTLTATNLWIYRTISDFRQKTNVSWENINKEYIVHSLSDSLIELLESQCFCGVTDGFVFRAFVPMSPEIPIIFLTFSAAINCRPAFGTIISTFSLFFATRIIVAFILSLWNPSAIFRNFCNHLEHNMRSLAIE